MTSESEDKAALALLAHFFGAFSWPLHAPRLMDALDASATQKVLYARGIRGERSRGQQVATLGHLIAGISHRVKSSHAESSRARNSTQRTAAVTADSLPRSLCTQILKGEREGAFLEHPGRITLVNLVRLSCVRLSGRKWNRSFARKTKAHEGQARSTARQRLGSGGARIFSRTSPHGRDQVMRTASRAEHEEPYESDSRHRINSIELGFAGDERVNVSHSRPRAADCLRLFAQKSK